MAVTNIMPKITHNYVLYICVILHSYCKHRLFTLKSYLWPNFGVYLLYARRKTCFRLTGNLYVVSCCFVIFYFRNNSKKVKFYKTGGGSAMVY